MYDAIIVGARCAGSPTAMLLARRGYRVLLLDKSHFPSDTMSTHLVHPPGIAALRRWGLLDRLAATGCPAIPRYSFDFGPLTLEGTPHPVDGVSQAYCPRRVILDELLIEAAAQAGAEVREECTVEEILGSDSTVTGVRGRVHGGGGFTEQARFVIGADGRHSTVARAVDPKAYNKRPSRMAMYYAYWSGLDVKAFATTIRAERRRGWAAAPTHDGLTMLGFGWPAEEFHRNRADIEGAMFAALALAPAFAEQVHAATRESRFVGSADVPGYFRRPYGPGWALVGDAGYHKNPITAMGITDAFRDAELLADALDDVLTGRRSQADAMADYQRTRDAQAGPVYEFTDDYARLEPPPPQMQQLLAAIHRDQDATDAFISVQAATLPAPAFFAPENLASITAAGAV